MGDSFDEILRDLTADYFSRCFQRIKKYLSHDAQLRLALGWMHPGYGVIQPDEMTDDTFEPARLFGWLSGRNQEVTSKKRMRTLAENLRSERPRLLLAMCSARAYRYVRVDKADHPTALELFIELALSDPTEWWIMTIAPTDEVPNVIWKRLCFAAAHRDKQLERETWKAAKANYTADAIKLLEGGLELTLKCTDPT